MQLPKPSAKQLKALAGLPHIATILRDAPATLPIWGTDPDSLIEVPPTPTQELGWTTSTGTPEGVGEKPPLQYFNWWQNLVYQWIAYLSTAPGLFVRTGTFEITLQPTPDTGWVAANDGTIGDAASNATTFADPSTVDLFELLWAYPAEWFPLFTSAGLPTTRGVSAAADFAANCAIKLGSVAGRALATKGAASFFKVFTADSTTDLLTIDDTSSLPTGTVFTVANTGGALPTGLLAATNYYAIPQSGTTLKVASSRANALAGTAIDITANGSGTNTLTVVLATHATGSYLGEEGHLQLLSELNPHPHPLATNMEWFTETGSSDWGSGSGGLGNDSTSPTGIAGGGQPFNVIQPTFYANVNIKL